MVEACRAVQREQLMDTLEDMASEREPTRQTESERRFRDTDIELREIGRNQNIMLKAMGETCTAAQRRSADKERRRQAFRKFDDKVKAMCAAGELTSFEGAMLDGIMARAAEKIFAP